MTGTTGPTPSLAAFLDAFNAHDVDAIMSFFTDDCVFDTPRGPAPAHAAGGRPQRPRPRRGRAASARKREEQRSVAAIAGVPLARPGRKRPLANRSY